LLKRQYQEKSRSSTNQLSETRTIETNWWNSESLRRKQRSQEARNTKKINTNLGTPASGVLSGARKRGGATNAVGVTRKKKNVLTDY